MSFQGGQSLPSHENRRQQHPGIQMLCGPFDRIDQRVRGGSRMSSRHRGGLGGKHRHFRSGRSTEEAD